ncbi:MAG: hypothetical protein ACLFVJ_09610 [Persicimonas sp.]
MCGPRAELDCGRLEFAVAATRDILAGIGARLEFDGLFALEAHLGGVEVEGLLVLERRAVFSENDLACVHR